MKKIVMALAVICCAYALTAQAQKTAAPVKAQTAADTLAGKNVSAGVAADTSINTVQSGNNETNAADTLTEIAPSDADSLAAGNLDIGESDSLDVSELDSFDDFDNDEELEIVTALADSVESVQKLGSVRREYDRDRQVKLAIVMMVFLIFALGTSQSFNPR